jgi:endonuclease YncB( thermonuclease family)
MKQFKTLLITFLAAAGLAAFVPSAWAAPVAVASHEAGRIVIDVTGHGEAWYVSPVTKQRTYLGRPQEAVGRLVEAGVYVSANDIAKVPEVVGGAGDAAYTDTVLGRVLVPNDIIGAAWYVDPALKIRRRLATASETWEVMRYGTPISKAALKAIAVAPVLPVTEKVACKAVTAGDKIQLADGRCIRLMNVSVPSNPELQAAAMDRLKNFCGASLLIERDVAPADADGCAPRHVFAGEVYLNYDLVRRGLAFQDIISPNFKHAELMITGSLDASKQKQGFWKK